MTIIKFKNITTEFNVEYSNLFSMSISPNSKDTTFDLLWKLSKTITNQIHADVNVFVKVNNLYANIFSYDFEICRLWDGFMSQTIARMWFKNAKKYGNITFTCPFKKVFLNLYLLFFFMKKIHFPFIFF